MKELINFILGFIIGIILIFLLIKILSNTIITREKCEINGGTFVDGAGVNNKCIYNKEIENG